MFIIGVFSLLQCWILPGLVLLIFFKNLNFLEKLFLSIPLSLFINYILVFALIFLKSFTQSILIIIVITEVILIFYFYRNVIKRISQFNLTINLEINNLVIIFFLFIVLFLAVNSIGKIHLPDDPLTMWDFWARELASGKLPLNSYEYPLGYSILQSITYVIIGTKKIEFFAQAVQLIFPLSLFLVFSQMVANETKDKFLIKITFLITIFLILNQFRFALFAGFVDTVLVLSSCIILYLIQYTNRNQNFLNSNKNIILLIIILSVPGITKQTGVFLSLISPILIFYKNKIDKNFLFNLLKMYSFIFLIIFPWYIYKFLEFKNNSGSLNSLNLLSLHYDELYLTKIKNTLQLIFGKSLILFLPLFLISFLRSSSRNIILLVILPYYLFWSYFYGNDARNFALILPFIGFVLANSVEIIINILKKNLKIKFLKEIFLIIGLIFVVFFINQKRSYEYMLDKQQKQEILRNSENLK